MMKSDAQPKVGYLISSLCTLSLLIPEVSSAAILEEVTVTASKREENLQDVAISVTAFSDQAMEDMGLTNSRDLGSFIPGIEMRSVTTNDQTITWIRGSGSIDFAPNANTTVGFYVDEVYLPSTFQHSTQLYDLERIEALRGPQGTLYGRNATGGAINLITAKPEEEFSAYANIGLGNYNARKMKGMITGGLSETVAGRLSFIYESDDGWMKGRGTFPGSIADNHLNEDNFFSARGLLAWEPQDDLSFLLNVHGSRRRADGGSFQHTGVQQTPFGAPCSPLKTSLCVDAAGYRDPDGAGSRGDTTEGDYDFTGDADSDGFGVYLTVDWQLDGFDFKSITAFDEFERATQYDTDASPNPISNTFYDVEIDGWAQELRLSSSGDDKLSWILGLYYAEDDVVSDNDYEFLGLVTEQEFTQEQTSFAVYANTGYQINDQLTLNVGLRYTRDTVDYSHFSQRRFGFGGPLVPEALGFAGDTDGSEADIDFDDVSWKIGLDYAFNDDWLFYATLGTGYKSGGAGAGFGDPGEFGVYDPEDILAYEIGFKSTLADGKARLNISAFYYDYQDLQIFDASQNQFAGQAFKLGNADEAEYYGGEVEFLISPIEGLEIMTGLSFLETEFKDFTRPFTGEDLSGHENVFAPSVKFTGVARYEWPMKLFAEGNMALALNWSYTDDVFHSVENDPDLKAEEVWLLGGRWSFTTSDEKLEVALWGQNLTDESFRVQSFDFQVIFIGSVTHVPNRPRTYGAEITYHW